MAQMSFDATHVAPQKAFEVIPKGKYLAKMVGSEMKHTKDGTGTYLSAEFEIADGQFVGRKIWTNFTISNRNEKAVEIGQAQFSGLCHACGVMQVQNSEQLHGIPVMASVKIVKDKNGQYEDSNDINGFEPAQNFQAPAQQQGQGQVMSGQQPTQQQQQPAQQQQQQTQQGSGAAPWMSNSAANAHP